MIFAKISELKDYKGLSKGLDLAIETIENGSYKKSPVSEKIQLDGDNVFYNVQNIETRKIEDGFFEVHDKYIDIHVVIEGLEEIGYAANEGIKESVPYDEKIDMQILLGTEQFRFKMNPENVLILFPGEPHMPIMAMNNKPEQIKKAIFKIKY